MNTAPAPSATKPTCTQCGRPFSRWQLTRDLGTGRCADCSHEGIFVARGSRPMAVTCERCGHHYKYRMDREGTGPTEEAAVENLRTLLEQECDVVPCPACRQLDRKMIKQRETNRRAGANLVFGGLAICGLVYLVSVAFGRLYYGVGLMGVFAVVAGFGKVIDGKPSEF